MIFLQIVGTSEDFEVKVDKKKTLKSAKQKAVQEVKEVFKKDDDEPNYLQLEVEDTTETFDLDDF